MIASERIEHLSLLALQWVKAQEAIVLKYGSPLAPGQVADAERAGVQDIARVRLLVVDRIPFPDNPELAEAARRTQIITDGSRGIALGHGIVVRADSWQDRELLLHQFVHVAQCERSGGLESYIEEYLTDRHTCPDFSVGSFEDEARQFARNFVAGSATAS